MDESPNHEPFFEGAERMARMWHEFAGRVAAASLGTKPEQTPPEAARAMRDAMLNAMGQAADDYLRTPEFREMMKLTLQQSIAFRQQLNEFLGRMQHELQGASRQDMDQLMQGLTHLETRLVHGLERMADRLEDLDRRLDALERGTGTKSRTKSKRSASTKRKAMPASSTKKTKAATKSSARAKKTKKKAARRR